MSHKLKRNQHDVEGLRPEQRSLRHMLLSTVVCHGQAAVFCGWRRVCICDWEGASNQVEPAEVVGGLRRQLVKAINGLNFLLAHKNCAKLLFISAELM